MNGIEQKKVHLIEASFSCLSFTEQRLINILSQIRKYMRYEEYLNPSIIAAVVYQQAARRKELLISASSACIWEVMVEIIVEN